MRKVLGVVLCALLLSGCVGIPTSGGVVTGDIIDEQVDPDLVALPDEPRPGAPQQEILEGFIAAMRGPQSGYAIARQFLASSIADIWNPDDSALVRTGSESIGPGTSADSLSYTVTSRAVVNANWQYTEVPPVQQTLTYEFVQEGGEWRISRAPDGIVLSQTSFNDVFSEQALYFFDPSYQYLVPDVRWFPVRATLTRRIVSELLEGPASWLQQGAVVSAFPTATTEVNSEVVSGTATIDLSSEALAASPIDRDRMRQQLSASLDVAAVEMTVGGLELVVPSGGQAAIRNPPVDPAVLIATADAFGFDTGEGVAPLSDLSAQVIGAGATAAALSSNRQTAAILTPSGVAVARTGASEAVVVDGRPELIAPSLDPFRFTWSVQGSDASSIRVFATDGTEYVIASSLPEGAQVVSIDVSRDGTRLLAYLSTSSGPSLVAAGIIRQQDTNIPTELGELFYLPAAPGVPVDATWVSDREVAMLSRGSEASPITLVEIGGPSTSLSQVDAAVTIVGGNGGGDGIRVLAPDGSIWQLRGGGGWVETDLTAVFLGTKH